MPLAEYVLAHSPGLGDSVVNDGFPLSEAVQMVMEWTGCPYPFEHKPLSAAEQQTRLEALIAKAVEAHSQDAPTAL